MRVRLTLAVGLVTAAFLGLATVLYSQRATSLLLDGVKADRTEYADVARLTDPGTVIGTVTSAPATVANGPGTQPARAATAASIYRELDLTGRLPGFWQLLGRSRPAVGTGILIEGDEPGAAPVVAMAGAVDGPSPVVLRASTVLDLGVPLLQGLSPGDLIVVGDTSSAVMVAAPVDGTAPVGSPIGTPVGGAVIGPEAAGSDAGAAAGPGDATPTEAQPVAAFPVVNVRSSLAGLRRDLLIASGLFTVLAMGAAWLLTGRALRPVEAITRQVDEIGSTGSGERVPVPAGRDEISHLARTVNTMLDRLDRSAATQRRFTADASHELRSPVALIRTEAEVALSHPESTDWAATTRSVLDEANRLEGLVDDLLVLASRDDRTTVIDRTVATDVDEVVLAEAARRRRVPVDVRSVLAGRVAAHQADVARIVRHLLDNAARHASSTVQVGVRPDGGTVVLVVDDDGGGVPEADRDWIFERFARLEESRSRDAGGAGLGLAVVASVVDALGGSVEVTTSPLGGARFTIRIPEAP